MKYSHATLFPPKPPRAWQPTASWWLGLDRAAFDQRASAEQPRMSGSKFANISTFAGYEGGERLIAARAVGRTK